MMGAEIRAQITPLNNPMPVAATTAPRTRWIHPHAVTSSL